MQGGSKGFAGRVTLGGIGLIVEFPYSPANVQAIKSWRGARFNRSGKHWEVPLQHLARLEKSPEFGRERLFYDFSTDAVEEQFAAKRMMAEEAEAAWKSNPFFVDPETLDLLNIEVKIRLGEKSEGLRVSVPFRSKARTLLEALPGVHYVRRDKMFALPAEHVTGFIQSLRREAIAFAVEKSAGLALQGGAEIRARVLGGQYVPTDADLQKALLGPRLRLSQQLSVSAADDDEYTHTGCSQFFRLEGWTTEQLRLLIPQASSFAQRKEKAVTLSEDGVLQLLTTAAAENIFIWKSREVLHFFASRTESYQKLFAAKDKPFPDCLLAVSAPPCCWTVGRPSTPGSAPVEQVLLMVEPEYSDATGLSVFVSELSQVASRRVPGHLEYTVPDSLVPEIYSKVSQHCTDCAMTAPVASREFVGRLRELEKREQRHQLRDYYQGMTDSVLEDLNFSDPTLTSRLFPHQRVAVEWLSRFPRGLLGDDMGLGKTLSVLSAFDALKNSKQGKHSQGRHGEVDFLLVVCPNSLTDNWRREAMAWLPALQLRQLPQGKQDRTRLLATFVTSAASGVDGLIVNYECFRLPGVFPQIRRIVESRSVMLCLDESQRVKNPRGKTFAALAEVAPLSRRRVLLSGTPAPKELADIWSQVTLLDDGERFGENYYDWLATVAEIGTKYSQYAVKRYRKLESREAVLRAQELMLRRRKEQVVNLPEKTFIFRDVVLTGEQKKRFDEVCKELFLTATSLKGETYVREINNVLEQYLRAVQIAANPRLVDESWQGEPAKFLELDEIVDEVVAQRDEKMVIWTNYLGNVNELVERYSKYGSAAFSGEVSREQRAKTVEAFQRNKEPRILVAVPAAGGVGITLTAAQTAVYVDKTWNAEHWLQSIDRIHRIGQTGTVNIISLHASGVDRLIAKNLKAKEKNQAELLGDVKAGNIEEGYPSVEELIEALTPEVD
ncbi:MAG: DEAD/DEAH box helicase [bacterium]|nr:DEAD/DEAH box helicase [bacterium]